MLQWGRRGEPAETSARRANAGVSACFNGAAGVNLRKLHDHVLRAARDRGFNGAAGVNLRKLTTMPALDGVAMLLQWGRRGEPAETATRCHHRAGVRGLQWGRRGEPAETASAPRWSRTAHRASMGPQG